jgi:phosphonate transport system substrate-binding protein
MIEPGRSASHRRFRFAFRAALFVVLVVLALLAACNGKSDRIVDLDRQIPTGEAVRGKDSVRVYRFGFEPKGNPVEESRRFFSLLRYLEKRTGYPFELRLFRNEEDGSGSLGSGIVDFAYYGALHHIEDRDKFGTVLLVRNRNAEGTDSSRSALFVRSGVDIRTTADLKGHSLALGAVHSIPSYWMPRLVLDANGVGINDLRNWADVGSSRKVVEMVLDGIYDAGGAQESVVRPLEQEGKVSIIALSDPFPTHGIAANRAVPPEVMKAVVEALVALDPRGADREALTDWSRTDMAGGFVAANHSDYDGLAALIRRLGPLPERGKSP